MVRQAGLRIPQSLPDVFGGVQHVRRDYDIKVVRHDALTGRWLTDIEYSRGKKRSLGCVIFLSMHQECV